MKLAILSDIHANLVALERCMEFIDKEVSADVLVCLGDIVGYGADPTPCIEIIKERSDINIRGNHDAGVAGTTNVDFFNALAYEAIMWTRSHISEEYRSFLEDLPLTAARDNVRFTHAAPSMPDRWFYIFNRFDAASEFSSFTEPVCFIGHTHRPCIFTPDRTVDHERGVVHLDPGSRYLINAGSVGQPRDGDPRLSFALLNTGTGESSIIRLDYDVREARRRILENGLPPRLGDRLLAGF